MTNHLSDRLAAELAVCEAAAEGPWEVLGRRVVTRTGEGDIHMITPHLHVAADAEFIATARTGYPAALRALQAMLEIHRPVDVEPSDTICGECSNRLPDGRYLPTVEYPCPTVQAITEHLGATDE